MHLAQHDEMIDTLAPDGADRLFGKAAFCQGEAGAVGLSRIPMVRSRSLL